MKRPLILGAAIGACVHVGGLYHFLRLAQDAGYDTQSLGPAVGIRRLVREIQRLQPALVAVSYRLAPETAGMLFAELKRELEASRVVGQIFLFGGPPPVATVARNSGLFKAVFDGTEPSGVMDTFLRGDAAPAGKTAWADTLMGRIEQRFPYPVIRHHFGRPNFEETRRGMTQLAESRTLDIISIAPDQNAQEHFFRPEEMNPAETGAGGVPIRTAEQMRLLYEAVQCGNRPLLRCYSGTRDLIKWAQMSVETIHNAWAAIPLCWYSVMDGRSTVPLREAIAEKQEAIRWYAERGVPVEINESHQWSLREAHDALAVAMSTLVAHNARKLGVRKYIAQFMLNTPPGTSAPMDIGKMLAKMELLRGLETESFTVYREVRAGIAHFHGDPAVAKGQSAASIVTGLALRPHILHIVGFSEADHAAFPEEIIESCQIAHGVLRNVQDGFPDLTADPRVQVRKQQLMEEATEILMALKKFGAEAGEDPWSDPAVLAAAIETGLLDAPHFRGNPHLCGNIYTRCIDGAWYPVDGDTGEIIPEYARLAPFTSSKMTNRTGGT